MSFQPDHEPTPTPNDRDAPDSALAHFEGRQEDTVVQIAECDEKMLACSPRRIGRAGPRRASRARPRSNVTGKCRTDRRQGTLSSGSQKSSRPDAAAQALPRLAADCLSVNSVKQKSNGTVHAIPSCRQLAIAFVGNALPRRCGIATFTTDLEAAIRASPEVFETAIIAMRDPGGSYAYPSSVRLSIEQDVRRQYVEAAEFINAGGFDVVCLQHEFGIFGGEAGEYIIDLMTGLTVPLVTTLHTVLDQPSAAQRVVMDAILTTSACIVVMAEKARRVLIEVYHAAPERIAVIPHGIPDAPFVTSDDAKRRLGYSGRKVILTFGLISPNKGIETMIEAMPAIVQNSPEAVYVVMGATHPQLLREAGESYRESLAERVGVLGLEDHVVFLDRFVDRPELLEHITMCDVYVTPYLEISQMTSGTLAYSHGLGRPVVSTPYWHAAELLDDGSGVLVPFGDPAKLGICVAMLLDDEPGRHAMGKKAYAASRPMTWENTAKRYISCFKSASRNEPRRRLVGMNTAVARLAQLPG